MSRKIHITIVVIIIVIAAIFLRYRYRGASPAQVAGNEVIAVPAQTPEGTSDGLTYRQVKLPPLVLQEFSAPDLVEAHPSSKEALAFSEIKEIRLRFSKPLDATSMIYLSSGNKVVGNGGSISQDRKELYLPVNVSAFNVQEFASGEYDVYYKACFAGDTCYNGQYGFYGISPHS